MNLNKREYSDGVKITSANLNAIQDNIIKYCVPDYSVDNAGQFLTVDEQGNMRWITIYSAEDQAF